MPTTAVKAFGAHAVRAGFGAGAEDVRAAEPHEKARQAEAAGVAGR